MLTDNDGIVRRCVIVVQNPRVVCPQIRSFLANCFTQTSHNAQIILLVDGLAFWKEFMMHNTSVIHENRKHHLLFRLKTTWFFRSRLIGWTPFTRLMSGMRVILINPRLVTNNYPFDEWWVGVDLGKHIFCDINAIPFLHEIQVFRHQLCSDTSEVQIINQNVLSGSVSNVQLLCNLSNGQFAAYGHPPFDFVDVFISFRRGGIGVQNGEDYESSKLRK